MSEYVTMGGILVFLMIMTYMIMGICIERYQCKFGHEAAYTIMIGMFISWIIHEANADEF